MPKEVLEFVRFKHSFACPWQRKYFRILVLVLLLFLAGLKLFGVNINLTVPLSFVLALGLLLFSVHVFVGPPCVPAVTAFFCKFATLLGR